MKTVNLQQGSPEWLAHRRTTRNASEAPAMMGVSPYVTRAELVRQYATGVQREIDERTQAIFDRGHEVEPALRALAEKIIGEDLYPVTGVSGDGYLGASFDGVTIGEDIIFEAKQHNAEKRRLIAQGVIPPVDYWQVVQQFAVCADATHCLYLCGDGTEDGTSRLWIDREMVAGDILQLLLGWQQFDADVASYQPEPVRAAPVAAPVEGFGALSLRVEGRIIASNLDAFKAGAEQFIARLPKPEDLQTDQDFADAKGAVKACEEAEARIKAAKDAAQAEMTDVDAAFRLADSVAQTIRAARLALDKVVKVEEQARKDAIVQNGAAAVRVHYDTLNASLGEHRIQPPQSLVMDLGAAIKGKKSLASMKDAVDTAVAGFKIAASEQDARVRANVHVLEMEQGSHGVLFPDRVVLCATKTPEDLRNLITARIAQAKAEEERRQQEARERQEREAAEAAAEQNTTGAEASAAAEPVATEPARAAATVAPVGRVGAAPTPAGAKIKLGDLNARISPIVVTADGLKTLGINPAAKEHGSTLYMESDFPRICSALSGVLAAAQQKKAA
jgi:putative phage-type endonuclease